MEMDYLPLGKQGCMECFELSYYCNECTASILEHVYAESRPTTHTADASPGERWLEEQGGIVELHKPDHEPSVTGSRR